MIFNGKSIYLILIGMFILSAVASPLFLTKQNIVNLLLAVTIVGIAALGQTFVIICGGFDLSMGTVISFVGSMSIGMLISIGLVPSLLISLVIGAVIGMINGIIVAKGKIEAFIATLAVSWILKSIILLYTNGYPKYVLAGVTPKNPNFGQDYMYIGGGMLFNLIPVCFIILVVAAVLLSIVLTKTKIGRYIYAVGGNKETARLSGINVARTQIIAFTICGAAAALAGIVFASRIGTALPTMGDGYELQAIAAVAIGGTALTGGRGGIGKTVTGAMIFTILANVLNLVGVSAYYQNMATGSIILAAVLINEWNLRKQRGNVMAKGGKKCQPQK
jgi:ribose transport system permease protein